MKLNSAQQNYPVHEQEMFAGVETMRRYKNLLLGTHFFWYTDHKGLIHLLKQKNLSGRQARWMETLSEFNFTIVYVEGTTNVLADALFRIYSNDASGTVCTSAEYAQHDEDYPPPHSDKLKISMPVHAGIEANVMTRTRMGILPQWTFDPKCQHQRWDHEQLLNLRESQVEGGTSQKKKTKSKADKPVAEPVVELIPEEPTVESDSKELKTTVEDSCDLVDQIRDRSTHADLLEIV